MWWIGKTPLPPLRKINCTFAECTCRKRCLKICGGGLRGAMRGWHIKQSPQNQLHSAECTCRKSCMVDCDVRSGVASKSLLKVRLRCRQPPQNQLHPANCTCRRKSCVVCCDVLRGVASKSPLKIMLRCKARHATNSAPAAPQNQLHLANASQKNCGGGLRCATRGWHLK